MTSLSNYLQTHRKRLALSQEEAGFLLGIKGLNKGVKVCRDEAFKREPSLQTALAYEAIYGQPVRELFAGIYEQIERDVAQRARTLNYRIDKNPGKKADRKRQILMELANRKSNQ